MFQSFFTFNSNAMRLLQGFVIGVALLLIPGILLALFFPSGSGDLSRIGHFPAKLFSPQNSQTTLARLTTEPSSADVLVLGDSFSAENAWQSQLTVRTGLRVATWRIEADSCIEPWLQQALTGSLSKHHRYIIIETVERAFLKRFVKSDEVCASTLFKPFKVDTSPLFGQPISKALLPIDIRHVLKTTQNAFNPQVSIGRFLTKQTVLVDLERHDLFSNTLSKRLLYLKEDEYSASSWPSVAVRTALERFSRLQNQAAAKGITLLLIVIPDKSTVYAPWIVPEQAANQAEFELYRQLQTVLGDRTDLLTPLRAQATRIRDLYRPDDTHLSVDGFRYLGDFIAETLLAKDGLEHGLK